MKICIHIYIFVFSLIYFQKRPRSRSLSQLPDDCILACRKTSFLNDKKEDTATNGSSTDCNSKDISDEKIKNKLSKSSRNDKSQVDSDTSDDERMVICEEDTNSGEKNIFVS